MGTLFVVSTPIGNLADLTRRAEAVLADVSRVLCEDTRRTRILLNHLGIEVPMVSLHAHNEASRIQKIMDWLGRGEDLALVSDAGTPLVSDPGARVVQAVVEAGHTVVPIPGPSAVIAALVASGLPLDSFTFLGFPARKGDERTALLARVADCRESVVFFESPERLLRLLEDLQRVCGGERQVAVAREITKIHEEFVRGTLLETATYYRENPPRGEVTVVIGPSPRNSEENPLDRETARLLASSLLARGLRPSAVAKEVTRRLGVSRNVAYRAAQEASEEDERGGEDNGPKSELE